jgi:hypothetical protein
MLEFRAVSAGKLLLIFLRAVLTSSGSQCQKHWKMRALRPFDAADVILVRKLKIKQSRKRPGVAHRVPGALGSQIS